MAGIHRSVRAISEVDRGHAAKGSYAAPQGRGEGAAGRRVQSARPDAQAAQRTGIAAAIVVRWRSEYMLVLLRVVTQVRKTKGCPLKKRAASTRSTAKTNKMLL